MIFFAIILILTESHEIALSSVTAVPDGCRFDVFAFKFYSHNDCEKLKIGKNVNMEKIDNYKRLNDALEQINESKVNLNDDLLSKALTEGLERPPFDFEIDDEHGNRQRQKEALQGRVRSLHKVVAPWLN